MRHTKIVTIDNDTRDKGKQFLITEMPASQAERWVTRAFFALGRAGIEVPGGLQQLGWAGMVIIGLRALARLNHEDATPLLEEMMGCVEAIPDPQEHPQIHRALIEGDIEEVETRLFLKSEVFELHSGFSITRALADAKAPPPPPDPDRLAQTSPSGSA